MLLSGKPKLGIVEARSRMVQLAKRCEQIARIMRSWTPARKTASEIRATRSRSSPHMRKEGDGRAARDQELDSTGATLSGPGHGKRSIGRPQRFVGFGQQAVRHLDG